MTCRIHFTLGGTLCLNLRSCRKSSRCFAASLDALRPEFELVHFALVCCRRIQFTFLRLTSIRALQRRYHTLLLLLRTACLRLGIFWNVVLLLLLLLLQNGWRVRSMLFGRWNSLLLSSGLQCTGYRLKTNLNIVKHHVKLGLLFFVFCRCLLHDWVLTVYPSCLVLLYFIIHLMLLSICCSGQIFILTDWWLTFHSIHKDDLWGRNQNTYTLKLEYMRKK